MENKTLYVPRIPGLDKLPIREVADIVERDGVAASIDVINWPAFPVAPASRLRAAHSGKTLYLHYTVEGDKLLAVHDEEQSAVCDDSCVEAFLKPAEGDYYWNIELNCIGAINAARRLSRNEFTPMDHADTSRIGRCGKYVGEPTFEEGAKEGTWDILMAIPLDIINVDASQESKELRGNFYSCSSGAKTEYYLTWNPIAAPEPDYHRPECFGKIILE